MRRPLGAATVPPGPTEHGTWTGAEAYDRFMGRGADRWQPSSSRL